VGDGVGGLEAVPVEAGDADLLVIGVEDLVAGGVPETGALGEGGGGSENKKQCHDEARDGRGLHVWIAPEE
jgi:hypothetical protein